MSPECLARNKWLGLERVDYEGLTEGRLIEAAGLYPGAPIIPEADWFALWDYYRDAAPSQARPQTARPPAERVMQRCPVGGASQTERHGRHPEPSLVEAAHFDRIAVAAFAHEHCARLFEANFRSVARAQPAGRVFPHAT